ncbi:MAG: ATP-dependent zinc protease [Sandaracinaceae bacterium]|nr:ATP-dependent zinc protease [Sandaracinaceae bacterium]
MHDSAPHSTDPLRGRTLIGITERVALPEWQIRSLRVKIDTGARTSALHVDEVELIDEDHVRFWVVLHRKNRDRRVRVETRIVRRARVRSSTGGSEERLFVATTIRLGPVEKEIEVSLARREPMIFRMLLGRSALAHDFVVDPSHRYVATPRRRPKRARPGSP